MWRDAENKTRRRRGGDDSVNDEEDDRRRAGQDRDKKEKLDLPQF